MINNTLNYLLIIIRIIYKRDGFLSGKRYIRYTIKYTIHFYYP